MKLYKRLLLTIPFVVVTFGYYKLDNPDEICLGPIYAIIMIAVYGVLLLTGFLAAVATFRRRPTDDKPTPEPITLSISLVALLFIVYDLTLRGHRNGEKWIDAECKNLSDMAESQRLSLRKNGNFTFSPNLDCAFSGEYKKIGDTIIFDKEMIEKIIPEMTTVYLLRSDKLIPLFDTINKITFTITQTK
ncbi:MAG: hypothetical protein QM802_24485 [Agriterribacter sp.]